MTELISILPLIVIISLTNRLNKAHDVLTKNQNQFTNIPFEQMKKCEYLSLFYLIIYSNAWRNE